MAKDPSASLQDRKIIAGAETSGIEREFWNLVADVEYLIQSSTTLPDEDLARAKAKLHARNAAAEKSREQLVTPQPAW